MENRQVQSEQQSLARQINLHWVLRTAWNYIVLDVLGAFITIVFWCGLTEYIASGRIDLKTPRSFDFGSSRTDLAEFLRETSYNFGDNTVPAGNFVFVIAAVFSAMIILQFLFLIKFIIKGTKQAKNILRPLNQLAESVMKPQSGNIPQTQSESADHDFTDLRTAIDRMDPMMSTSHIHTGNSDLEELENAVNSLLDRMRESYSRQAQFVSDASHELRTPIAVIKGYADMLERWGKSDPAILDEGITAIKNESEHMGRLAEQLLFLARGDNGRQTVNMDIFSLSDMMNEVCSEYRVIDDKHCYTADIRGDFKAYGDSSLIKQTIRILTDNAKKYTPEGGEITLCVRRNIQGEVCFDVIDTGIGMEQEDIEHIFERFYRADPARNRDTGGTGLGLSIAKWIVERHNGHFEISSCVGIGTKITVVLEKIKPDSADFILDEEKKSRWNASAAISRAIGGASRTVKSVPAAHSARSQTAKIPVETEDPIHRNNFSRKFKQ